MAVSYEEQRVQNIRDNEALLLSLGLVTPGRQLASKVRPALIQKASNTSAKRKRAIAISGTDEPFEPDAEADAESDVGDVETPTKTRRTGRRSAPSTPVRPAGTPTTDSGLRRSTRGSAKKSYTELKENDVTTASPSRGGRGWVLIDDDDDDDEGGVGKNGLVKQRNNKRMGERTQDPKKFGHIPGVEIGRWWATRMEASTDAVHAPFVAGIYGNPKDGAWSVALSGGYADDVDLGSAFTYTGSGGRDLKGTKDAPKNLRTAPQTTDQTFDNPMNAALKRSAETRKPVRVIRGFKLPSPYAPAEGYRYDGLYIVEKAWMAKGLTKGLLVCRYAFKRMPGQGQLPIRSDEPAGAEE